MKEGNQLHRYFNILRQTEGYPLLTPRQQEFIELSLYTQQRSLYSKNDEPNTHILEWSCHAAVNAVETGNFSVPGRMPDDLYRCHYESIANYKDLRQKIEAFGFPCVVHITKEYFNILCHSFLTLGHNKRNSIVIWEKVGDELQYQLTTLKQEIAYYNGKNRWGIRKLRQPDN